VVAITKYLKEKNRPLGPLRIILARSFMNRLGMLVAFSIFGVQADAETPKEYLIGQPKIFNAYTFFEIDGKVVDSDAWRKTNQDCSGCSEIFILRSDFHLTDELLRLNNNWTSKNEDGEEVEHKLKMEVSRLSGEFIRHTTEVRRGGKQEWHQELTGVCRLEKRSKKF
jgi:hypothetical protein